MKGKNLLCKLLLPLTLTLTLTGCGFSKTKETSTVADTKKPTELTIYTAIEEAQINTYLEPFKKEHPEINLNIVRAATGDITARLIAEKDNPQADVVWGLAATSLLLADGQKILEPYAPKGVENIPAQFKSEGQTPSWVGIDAFITAITVNTKELEKRNLPIPKSYADLVNPSYKGLVVMPNPQSSGTGFISVSAWMQLMGKDSAFAYMDKLHENIGVYTHSGSAPAKMAASGEYPIGISYDWKAIQLKKEGYPVEVVFPAEKSGWDLEANALVKKKEIKAEAKTFLDWAIGKEVMTMYGKNYAITTLNVGGSIPEGFPSKPLDQIINNNLKWAATNREDILKQWIEKYDGKSQPKQ